MPKSPDKRGHGRGSGDNAVGDFVISGTQLGIGRTDNLSTLTVQARNEFTLSGTLSVPANSATVTGTSTKFLSELVVGDIIEFSADFFGRKGVIAIASDTSLTLDSPASGGYSGTFPARPSAARFDDGSGNPQTVITGLGTVGIGTIGPRGMLEVNGQGSGELDGCPVGIRVHSPLNSDVWPLVMSTDSNDGTTDTTTGLALWATQMSDDGGATLTFSVFNNDQITVQDHVKIDGNGLHLASQFSANVGGVSGTYAVGALDHYIYVQAGSGGATVTLPDAGLYPGRVLFVIKLNGAGDVTVAAPPGDTINGVASKTISTQFSGLHLVALYPGFWLATVMPAA